MTVAELRKCLEVLDGDLRILVSHDPEGNSFSDLFHVEQGEVESFAEQIDDQLMTDISKTNPGVLIIWPAS